MSRAEWMENPEQIHLGMGQSVMNPWGRVSNHTLTWSSLEAGSCFGGIWTHFVLICSKSFLSLMANIIAGVGRRCSCRWLHGGCRGCASREEQEKQGWERGAPGTHSRASLSQLSILCSLPSWESPVKAELGRSCSWGGRWQRRGRGETRCLLFEMETCRTHSFLTAWCTSVHPWGSSSGPWGRPESAWSWGEKRAQGSAKQPGVLIKGQTLSDTQHCIQAGTLPKTNCNAGGNDWLFTPSLPELSHMVLERNAKNLGLWNNFHPSCLLQVVFHCNAALDSAEQRAPTSNSFAASVFISCLRLETVWINSKPRLILWTPQIHF